MSQPIQEMLPEIMQGRCIIFLGAGSSVSCESPYGGGLTGEGLKNAMVEYIGEDPANFPTSLREVSEFVETSRPRHRSDLDDFIYTRLRDLRPTIGHLLLTMFPWRAVVTTNFNQAIEQGYADALARGLTTFSCRPVLTDSDLANLTLNDREIPLFKPHGCISGRGNHHTPMVLTPRDYYFSIQKRRAIYDHIRELAQSFVTIFVGYSFDDYTFNNIFYELQTTLHEYLLQSYAVVPVPIQKAKYMERSYAERRITLINDKAETFLLSLAHQAGLLTEHVSDVAVEELLRPAVLTRLGSYAASLPEPIRDRMPA